MFFACDIKCLFVFCFLFFACDIMFFLSKGADSVVLHFEEICFEVSLLRKIS